MNTCFDMLNKDSTIQVIAKTVIKNGAEAVNKAINESRSKDIRSLKDWELCSDDFYYFVYANTRLQIRLEIHTILGSNMQVFFSCIERNHV